MYWASAGLAIGPPWARHQDVRANLHRRARPGVDQRGAVCKLRRGLRADGAAGGQAHVATMMSAPAWAIASASAVEDVRRGQHIQRVGGAIISTSSA